MPEYINPNSYVVHLVGPDGVVVNIRPYTSDPRPKVLDAYFDKYVARGFIKLVSDGTRPVQQRSVVKTSYIRHNIAKPKLSRIIRNLPQSSPTQQSPPPEHLVRELRIAKAKRISRQHGPKLEQTRKQTVGRQLALDATEILKSNVKKYGYPISNNIGVGILSYQRLSCLRRLIDSILKCTDLNATTIFISDDGSADPELHDYLDNLKELGNFVVLKNDIRIGIAGNSNRLLQCLSRFRYGILLNDDVEILQSGWEYLYADALLQTNMHHFIYREVGIYGAKLGEGYIEKGVNLRVVHDKPHGAVLAFTNDMIENCGYFDESYDIYGMEHVDWSQKVWEFGLQRNGFFDVDGSQYFFKIHDERTATEDKTGQLQESRKIFAARSKKRCIPRSTIPEELTYVIPVRDVSRNDSIDIVINNIRAQRFPRINIMLVEHDSTQKIDRLKYSPITGLFIPAGDSLFNKSMAFNRGVMLSSGKIVLHDADMLTNGEYATRVWNVLGSARACHLGGRVLYADKESTSNINDSRRVTEDIRCERIVGYFEGGSLACDVETYWGVGGFNEDYSGYGCEDCDFYARLSAEPGWTEDRIFDFLHLWHPRTIGWNNHHAANKNLEVKLNALSIEKRIILQLEQIARLGYFKSR
jgi:hypothetical protein